MGVNVDSTLVWLCLVCIKLNSVSTNDLRFVGLSRGILFVICLIGMLLVRITSMGINVDSTLVWLSKSKQDVVVISVDSRFELQVVFQDVSWDV